MKFFYIFVDKLSETIGNPYMLIAALFFLIVWFIAGAKMHYDETWYKWFHISLITITFIIVFAIQSTQNADTKAMQRKLDEILKKLPQTDNKIAGIEKKLKEGKKI